MGDDTAALQEMTRLRQTRNLQPTFKTAFNLSSIPARYALERRDWAGAARLEPRPDPALDWDAFPWPEAVTWFARGMGAARSGDIEGARAAEARLVVLRDASQRLGEDLFARQTEILRLAVAGWVASLAGETDTAVRLLEQAVVLETSTPKHPVTPAPTIPAAELLGDLLLEANRPAEALQSYQASLKSSPNLFNTLVGAARAARKLGDDALAARYYGEVRALAVSHSARPELAEAIAFRAR
jgi:tetratricopeptide (TPR) repeat protein